MSGWWHRPGTGRAGEVLSCRQAARVLQSYLDGELDEVTARRVAAHLEDCRHCGLEADTYTEIKKALAQRAALPAGAVERLRAFGENLLAAPEATPGRDADGEA
jgi:anti-sigma factor (TIGR02949 family)